MSDLLPLCFLTLSSVFLLRCAYCALVGGCGCPLVGCGSGGGGTGTLLVEEAQRESNAGPSPAQRSVANTKAAWMKANTKADTATSNVSPDTAPSSSMSSTVASRGGGGGGTSFSRGTMLCRGGTRNDNFVRGAVGASVWATRGVVWWSAWALGRSTGPFIAKGRSGPWLDKRRLENLIDRKASKPGDSEERKEQSMRWRPHTALLHIFQKVPPMVSYELRSHTRHPSPPPAFRNNLRRSGTGSTQSHAAASVPNDTDGQINQYRGVIRQRSRVQGCCFVVLNHKGNGHNIREPRAECRQNDG